MPPSTNGVVFLLKAFHLSTMAAMLETTLTQAEQEQWGYLQLLQVLCESEYQQRQQHTVERLLKQAHLPEGKTLSSLQENLLPVSIRRQLPTLLDGGWVERGDNLLVFGLPGRGKTHFLSAVAHELMLRHHYKVHFTTTVKLVQQLLAAKQTWTLERQLKKLDHFDIVLLDDLGYVQQSREEMEVLFTFFAERYERKSLMISSNLVFSQWDQIFKDPMTTMAAVDRLVHHAIILEFTGESLRAQQAQKKPPV